MQAMYSKTVSGSQLFVIHTATQTGITCVLFNTRINRMIFSDYFQNKWDLKNALEGNINEDEIDELVYEIPLYAVTVVGKWAENECGLVEFEPDIEGDGYYRRYRITPVDDHLRPTGPAHDAVCFPQESTNFEEEGDENLLWSSLPDDMAWGPVRVNTSNINKPIAQP